ncbi:MAG: putative ABC transporter permease [Oscillospiraceae bacterium]|nr:putative ABC transporter permease [Oscillospiraceae bacterium]
MGWVLESAIESVSHKRFINRGFLTGPYIPIYGIGGILFSLIGIPLKAFYPNPYINIILVFVVGALSATTLEYAAGSFLERAFKKQLWDYSALKITNKFSYKNRISLVSSLFWGVCSVFMTFFLYDVVSTFTLSLNMYLLAALSAVMTLIIGFDAIVQIKRHVNIQETLKKLSYEQLREFLMKNLLKTGKRRQIREFRDAVFKNINENIKKNIETIRRLRPNGEPENNGTDVETAKQEKELELE